MKSSRGHIVQRKSQIPRLIVTLFALAGLAALVTLLSIFSPQIIALFRGLEPNNENHTWLTRDWTQVDRTPEDVAAMVEILTDNRLTTAYLQTGSWHGQTGDYVELPYTQSFLGRFHAQTSAIKLFVWIVVPPDKLADAESRLKVVAYARQAVLEEGFAGVHIQARSVPNESEEFIDLLKDLQTAIGPQAVLSITVPPDRTPLDPDVPASPVEAEDLTWSQEYKRRVLLNVDEIVLMAHASSLDTSEDYHAWLAYQVANYAEIIQDLQIDLIYIVALPTYDAELGHDPQVESVEIAIEGVKGGIRRARDAGTQVDGVGLYPWEQTDLIELDTYWAEWVKRGQ